MLLGMPKRVFAEDWESRLHSDQAVKPKKRRQVATFERKIRLKSRPEDSNASACFEIELVQNFRTDAVGLTLYAAIGLRPMLPICRYDFDDNEHENPDFCAFPSVTSGSFHRHVYNERAVRELDRWDACAEKLELPTSGGPKQLLDRLKGRFLQDLHIRFERKDDQQSVFQFGN